MDDYKVFGERLSFAEELLFDHFPQLNNHVFYETPNAVFAGQIISNSATVAKTVTDLLFEKVFEVLYDKYLDSKRRPHEIGLTLDLIKQVNLIEFIGFDGVEHTAPEDNQAASSTFDNYCRARIPSKAHQFIPEEINKEQIPEPIDLKELAEDTSLEDQLREAKERTKQRLMQEEAQRKLLEEAANIERLKLARLNAGLTNKNYTFDYNGNVIILTKDKLPQVAAPINFAVNSKTSEDQLISNLNSTLNISKNTSKDLSRILKQKRAPIAEREFTKMIIGPPAVFEDMKPQMGVKITQGGRKKEGPIYTLASPTHTTATLGSSSSLSSHRLSKDAKMRKEEYLRMIHAGNLSRQGLNAPLEEDRVLTEVRSNDSLESSKLSLFKGSVTGKPKPKVSKLFSHRELTIGTVHMHSPRLSEIMNTEPDAQSALSGSVTGKGQNKAYSIKADDTLQTSKIDSFNMNIISSKDWGRNISVGMAANVPTALPKGAQRTLALTLGMKPKYPRDRLSRVATNSSSILGSPKIFTRDTYAPFSP